MKSRTLIAAIFAVAVAASPAAAQNVAGTWELSVTGGRRGGTQTMTLVMAQDGGALTGTLTRTLGRRGGGGGGGPMELKLEDGTVEGNSFSFSVTLIFNDNSFTQSFSGTVDGDAMEGSIEGGRGGPQPFTGERN
jgi:hypothetical protein